MNTSVLDAPAATTPAGTLPIGADERLLLRGGPLAAMIYAAAIGFAAWFLSTTHPAFDASPLQAAAGFRDNAWQLAVSTMLFLLPMPFVLMFLGGLTATLRRAGGALTVTMFAAGLLDLALFASASVTSSIVATIGALDASTATGAVIKALDGVLPVAIAVAGLARTAQFGCAAVLLRRTGLVGRGLLVFTVVVAALGALGVATVFAPLFFPVTELAMILGWVWMAVLGIRLERVAVRQGDPQAESRVDPGRRRRRPAPCRESCTTASLRLPTDGPDVRG